MHIWTSTIGQRLDNAENTRTMLLADYLIQNGHEVTLWTSAYDHIRKEWRSEWKQNGGQPYTMDNGVTVRFMKGCGYKRNISLLRLIDHLMASRDFVRQAECLEKPDAVVASIPDHVTASAVIKFAHKNGITSLIDVRDKWPDIFVDYAPTRLLQAAVKLLLVRESARAREALRKADALVAMMQSMLDWGLAKAGRRPTRHDRVFYLTTMAEVNESHYRPDLLPQHQQEILAGLGGKMTFIFAGTFNKTQHPLLVLDALDILRNRGSVEKDRFAVLIGGDGIEAEKVQQRSALHDNVHLLGWLKPDEMSAALARSDVGLLPLNFPSPAFNNKAFAYLASGLAFVNCALGDLEELVADEGIGINVPGGDPEKLADAISELVNNPAKVQAMRDRTKKLFAASFDRHKNYQAYVQHIEDMVEQRRGM